jgi:death-on-curing protein
VKEPQWIQRDSVLALHDRLLAEFGGASGIRNENILESALKRPLNRFSYENPTIFELAASYTFGLVRNHPFTDGNKRIEFTTAVLFLELNGYHFVASEADATIQTLALAAGDLDEKQYAAWLRQNSKKQKAR